MATRAIKQTTNVTDGSSTDAPGPTESEEPVLAPSSVQSAQEASAALRAAAAVPDASPVSSPRSLASRLSALVHRLLPQPSSAQKKGGADARMRRARPRAVGVVPADWEYVTRIAGRDALLRWAMGNAEEINRRG